VTDEGRPPPARRAGAGSALGPAVPGVPSGRRLRPSAGVPGKAPGRRLGGSLALPEAAGGAIFLGLCLVALSSCLLYGYDADGPRHTSTGREKRKIGPGFFGGQTRLWGGEESELWTT
jgi:hypothetical protein